MFTYQDFAKEAEKNIEQAINSAIVNHKSSEIYKTALQADKYDRQQNEMISEYVKIIFTLTGTPVEDFTAANNKLCSNFFHRLNTQRNTYLLGNGVSFTKHVETITDELGAQTKVDETKEYFGDSFDRSVKKIAYKALIHAVCFGFWNVDKLHVFPITEFAPLWDEYDGTLKAGVRFWQVDKNKPMTVVLYEEDGYTKYRTVEDNAGKLEMVEEKKPYKTIISKSEDGGEEVVGEENYGILPIIPMWGSEMHQSTLVGMKEKIDSFDLIRSGFANDLTDCAEIYWIVENYGGMTEADLEKFRDRLKINHIASANTADGGKIAPYTQEVPYVARKTYLDDIRSGIYEDFGGLDVHTVSAGATNDHIDAAYQPMDEEADDLEFQVLDFIHALLDLVDIDDDPIFKRNRISNQKEQTDMILSAADYLDDETILKKLPFITIDEVADILSRKDTESMGRFSINSSIPPEDNEAD